MAALFSPVSALGSSLSLDPDALQQSLSDHFLYLPHRPGMTPEQVRKLAAEQWQQPTGQIFNFGHAHTPYWFRLTLRSPDSQEIERLIELNRPTLDIIDLYLFRHGQELARYQLGDARPVSNRPLKSPQFIVPVTIAADDELELLIYVDSRGFPFHFSASLWKPTDFFLSQFTSNLLNLMIIGAIAALGVYNLFIYFATRERAYFYYLCYVVGFLYVQCYVVGLAQFYLFPETPQVNQLAFTGFFIPLSRISVYLFAIHFLRLAERVPRLCWFMQLLAAIDIFNGLAGFSIVYFGIESHPIFLKLNGISYLLNTPVCLFAGLYLWLRGVKEARFYTLAWFILTFASIGNSLSIGGLIPYHPRIFFFLQIAQVLEMLLLSFALADRIQQMRQRELAFVEERASSAEALIEANQQLHSSHMEKAKADHRAETAALESKAKSEFLATMSHEIRTPMNGVLGMSELLMETQLNQEQRRFVDTINDSGRNLLVVINDILDYSKIEAGKMSIEQVDFELEAVVDGCSEVFALKVLEKNITLACAIGPGVPLAINGDPTRLRQVLLNLLGNAFKFTDRGEITLKVSLEQTANPSKSDLLFEVCDTGIGMSEAYQQNLFEQFSQEDGSTTRRFGGTGLGLAISKQLVELMSGTISVESEVGRGSCFYFSLPCRLAGAEFSPAAADFREVLTRKRLLIVEPNRTIANFTALTAQSWGMHCHLAHNCEQAQTLLFKNGESIDLLLLDQTLLENDNYKLTQLIQERPEIYPKPGIVLFRTLSGADKPAGHHPQLAGLGQALDKPVTAQLLRAKLAQALGRREDNTTAKRVEHRQFSELRVLIAEDNSVNRMVIKAQIAKLGITATFAEDGLLAVSQVEESHAPFDVIFMDCDMPGLDGFDATRAIRLIEAGRKRVGESSSSIIIALTAHVGGESLEAAKDSGMTDYLSKPTTLGALEELLELYFPLATNSGSAQ